MRLSSRGRQLDLTQPHVMGILNITPDSFYDGGRFYQLEDALRRVEQMVSEGATLIDVGGESSRPGAQALPLHEEMARVIPVISAIVSRFAVWVSVDTYKPEVMVAAADVGAYLINDISALQTPGALAAAAESRLPICLMHMQGQPATMQQNPCYAQPTTEIMAFFRERIAACVAAGIPQQRLLLDPGFGFGKSLQHNYQLLSQLTEFSSLGPPLLVGLSRKSMISRAINVPAGQSSLMGSVAAAVVAVMQGARIVRVHDVKETVEALQIAAAVLTAQSNMDKSE